MSQDTESGLVSIPLQRELDTPATSDEQSYCVFTGKPIEQVLIDIGREVAAENRQLAMPLPEAGRPVLAQIKSIGDLGSSTWHEVVFYGFHPEWCAYEGSKTFKDGEQVLQWRYVDELMPSI